MKSSLKLNLKSYKANLIKTKKLYQFKNFDIFLKKKLPKNFAVLRHDIDISPVAALEIAKIEANLNVFSTFTILLNGSFYNPFEKHVFLIIKKILNLGHKIGLHFDAKWHGITSEKELEKCILRETYILNELFCLKGKNKIRMFSFHNTTSFTMKCEKLMYGELLNAYASKVKKNTEYISDSNGYWIYRSWKDLLKEKHPRIQILTHPEWWTEKIKYPAEKISEAIEVRKQKTWNDYNDLLMSGNRKNISGLDDLFEYLLNYKIFNFKDIVYDWLSGNKSKSFFSLWKLFDSVIINILTSNKNFSKEDEKILNTPQLFNTIKLIKLVNKHYNINTKILLNRDESEIKNLIDYKILIYKNDLKINPNQLLSNFKELISILLSALNFLENKNNVKK